MSIQVIIDQAEIERAIRNHIEGKMSFAEGQNVSIDLKAGRGENGFTATIVIGDEEAGAEPTTDTVKPQVTGPFKRNAAVTKQTTPTQTATSQDATSGQQSDTASNQQDTPTADAGEQEAPAQDAAAAAEPTAEGGAKAKGGLFAHLGNRTGTDKTAE